MDNREEIEQIVKDIMIRSGRINKYVGMRYVPLIDGEWDNTKKYEPLTVVTHQGNSYTSKTFVPIGADINDLNYWIFTGNYNAQIDQYRSEVENLKENVNTNSEQIRNFKSDSPYTFNVLEHGIIGDGTTENDIKFLELMQKVQAGDIIYFPSGVYIFNSAIELNITNIKICGNGKNTVLQFNHGGIVLNNYWQTISDLKLTTNNLIDTGMTILSSYCNITDVILEDYENKAWKNCIKIGSENIGAWFNIINNIIINNSGTTTRHGVGFLLTSSVNNIITNTIINAKEYAFKFTEDRSVGYSTDGCQITSCNIVTCNFGLYSKGNGALYIDNTIFDQIVNNVIELYDTKNVNINNSYLSNGSLSNADSKVINANNCSNINISECTLSGTPCDYGIVLYECKYINIINSFINNMVNAINADNKTSNCDFTNLTFNENVTKKLINQGTNIHYEKLKGYGDITNYTEKQITTSSINGSLVITTNETNKYEFTIPLQSGLVKPQTIALNVANSDVPVVFSYKVNESENELLIAIHRLDGNFNNDVLQINYSYPLEYKKEG